MLCGVRDSLSMLLILLYLGFHLAWHSTKPLFLAEMIKHSNHNVWTVLWLPDLENGFLTTPMPINATSRHHSQKFY